MQGYEYNLLLGKLIPMIASEQLSFSLVFIVLAGGFGQCQKKMSRVTACTATGLNIREDAMLFLVPATPCLSLFPRGTSALCWGISRDFAPSPGRRILKEIWPWAALFCDLLAVLGCPELALLTMESYREYLMWFFFLTFRCSETQMAPSFRTMFLSKKDATLKRATP